jgi:hypothetical protein
MCPQQDLHFTNVNICTQITENSKCEGLVGDTFRVFSYLCTYIDIGEMKVLLGIHLEFSVICVHILTLVK